MIIVEVVIFLSYNLQDPFLKPLLIPAALRPYEDHADVRTQSSSKLSNLAN